MNDSEKLIDIANIIDYEWHRKISEDALLAVMELALSESIIKAIHSRYFCSKCVALIKDETELNSHVFDCHRDLIVEAEIGEPNIDKMMFSIAWKLVSNPLGARICTVLSGYLGDEISEQLLKSVPKELTLDNRDPADLQSINFERIPPFPLIARDL